MMYSPTSKAGAWLTVGVVTVLALLAFAAARNVENDDNLLAFMPRDNPDVDAFQAVNELFGSLDLALVGIEADDAFQPDFLRRLQITTREIKETRGINHVLTLVNVVDFAPDPERGGIVTTPLIERVPESDEQREELRRHVMSKENVAGRLVARVGRAVLLYCFLAYGSDPREVAESVRQVIDANFSGHKVYYGGGPFVSAYIYETTRQDIRRLTPWAVVVVVVMMLFAFRDIIGVGLVLLSTGLGVLMAMGIMGVLEVKFNIVLGSLPVILFAIGSAYGIHLLARYYALLRGKEPGPALAQAVSTTRPVLLVAGLTTSAGLLSFVMMDIQPLRAFGLFTSIGLIAALVLSFTFIPAVLHLTGMRRRVSTIGAMRNLCAAPVRFARRHRLSLGLGMLALSLALGGLAVNVKTAVDTSSFFSAGSPPDLAEKFLRQHFGGSQFVQVHIRGDLQEPAVLREIQALSDRAAQFDDITDVMQIADAVAQADEAFVGQRRIPDTVEQVAMLHRLLLSDPSVDQLSTRDRSQALLHFKLRPALAEQVELVLKQIEELVKNSLVLGGRVESADPAHPEAMAVARRLVSVRLQAQAKKEGLRLEKEQLARMEEQLSGEPLPADPLQVAARLERVLRSEECSVDLATQDPALPGRVAAAVSSLGPAPAIDSLEQKVTEVMAGAGKEASSQAEDVMLSLASPLEQIWREETARAKAVGLLRAIGLEPDGPRGQKLLQVAIMALVEVQQGRVLVPDRNPAAPIKLSASVTGLPVMHRGLSRSATSNQLRSLVFALVLVVLIMTLYFRSLRAGLLASSPTFLTLLLVYGGMGLIGVRLDIGTAMLASLVLGAGVDYAVHLTAAWRAEPGESVDAAADRAAREAGPAIWTNALTVAVGFFVLTLGEARPLKNVGSLTAAAMLLAAAATFLLIPVLTNRRSYRPVAVSTDTPEPLACERAVRKSK